MKSLILRATLAALLCALSSASPAALTFAINEGVSYRVSDADVRAKYGAIAADLTKLLKQPVSIEPVAEYPRLSKGLAAREYDLALVHPAHLSIVAIKQSGYKLLAVTKGFQTYSTHFLVRADSPLKTLADLKGVTLGAPDQDSITSWLARATIRDAVGNADQVKYSYTRYQDAVPFFVENRLTQAGATASGALIKSWQTAGGRVLGKSREVPIKHVIASPSLSPEVAGKVREYLLALDSSDEGRKKLEPTKYQGFAAFDEAELLTLGHWLGL
nr:phosphate/phosphite/phosphonate ABC transporter substrate-binding protein [uncultured Roseateles sp.]